ncbi:MAG: MgtC/SapB family protein [Paludibacteraceae bacterium]|nr:MgtC/SapB family protein [Paludibacteraceae bacterium]
MNTLNLILRIVLATGCGALIGIDREYRTKAAGFRTHVLVALGSALFMVVSMYGFEEVRRLSGASFDPSRIASQVVTGIGFIGAGTILFQKNSVRGLTTAAGLWVTAAIGLACGAGLYWIAGVATLLVLLCLEGFNYFLRHMNRRGDKNEEAEM